MIAKHQSLMGLVLVATLALACIQPASKRSDDERAVGLASLGQTQVRVEDGLAAVRELREGYLLLWAQAPVLRLTIDTPGPASLRLEVRNCTPDAQLRAEDGVIASLPAPRPVWCHYDVDLRAGSNALELAPPDWQEPSPFRFADMGDIQTAMDRVDEVFATISATPGLRFVMSTGDITENGEESEYDLFEDKLAALTIPYYSTIGNHELASDIRQWHERFGRYSVHFRFKDTDFSFVDSASASLDPSLLNDLEQWLDRGQDRVHIFGTHYPPVDPVGARSGDFRSRTEAFTLLSMLAQGNVDLALYGHIHSYYEFSNAGVPSYISGGGGARPERFDGIGRHFLVVEVDPADNQVLSVERIEVDP